MAGCGKRSGLDINKTLYKINNIPLFMYTLNKIVDLDFDEIIVVCSKSDKEEVDEILPSYPLSYKTKVILGGQERYISVKNAIKEVHGDIVFIHDAARPLTSIADIKKLLDSSVNYLCGSLVNKEINTIRCVKDGSTSLIDRSNIYQMSTPQFFNKKLFSYILNNDSLITDELVLFENKYDIAFVECDDPNNKLTTKQDIDYITYMLSCKYNYFIGHSLDYHPFSKSGTLVLGGVKFASYPILEGHSDADVVYHAVTEAIMGATGLGDLGTLFPDTDPLYKDIDSSILLDEVISRTTNLGYEIQNIDVMVYLLEPKLKDYKLAMASNIKEHTKAFNVSVKAATLNKKGLISLNEGIASEAIVLVKKITA